MHHQIDHQINPLMFGIRLILPPFFDSLHVAQSMQRPISDRVRELRREISEINEANLRYEHGGKALSGAEGDQQRRAQRLQQIMDELKALIDWKKT